MNEQNTVQESKKEERVQEAPQKKPARPALPAFVVAPTPVQAQRRLKAERVQARLKRLPGWRARSGGTAIDRVREFSDPQVAASYLAYAAQLARQWDQPLQVSVNGKSVLVVLPGRSTRAGAWITEEMLDLAEQLG